MQAEINDPLIFEGRTDDNAQSTFSKENNWQTFRAKFNDSDGAKTLEKNTVLDYQNGLVRITPFSDGDFSDNREQLKKCMFSIENLAWKDSIDSLGKLMHEHPGECTLFPSKENRDWSTFKKPIRIKEGTHVMCSNGDGWFLREYAGGKEVALDEGKLVGATVTVKYIVPATEFDFTDFHSNKSKSII